MKIKKLSLRSRIFIAMILLVLLASVLIAAVTIYQYNEEAKDYHRERLERKEKAIRKSIEFTIQETTYPVTTPNEVSGKPILALVLAILKWQAMANSKPPPRAKPFTAAITGVLKFSTKSNNNF